MRLRRVRPQPAGVAVEPAHVALVDGLDVVADRAVVAVGVPRLLQRGRHLEVLGDLDAGEALVEQSQRLVVQIGVQIPLQGQEFDDPVAAPGRPVVRGEHDVGAVGEAVDGLGQIARPAVRVADQRAAQRQQVVQVVGGVLGHAQRAVAAGSRSASRRAPRCRAPSGTRSRRRRWCASHRFRGCRPSARSGRPRRWTPT